jgi:hypothetical protein
VVGMLRAISICDQWRSQCRSSAGGSCCCLPSPAPIPSSSSTSGLGGAGGRGLLPPPAPPVVLPLLAMRPLSLQYRSCRHLSC